MYEIVVLMSLYTTERQFFVTILYLYHLIHYV